MNEITDFFHKLFRPDSWPARWHCGNWTGFHGWLYILSSLAIAAAYFCFPLFLYILIKRSSYKLPFQRIFWLFILFIFACGFTHVLDALMFWYPIYRVTAVVLFITALASWAALISLVKIVPTALALKSPEALAAIIKERTDALSKTNEYLTRTNEELQAAQNESQLLIKQKDDFLSIASHEFKTPVTSLKVVTQILHNEAQARKDNKGLYMIDKMDKQLTKLTSLINDLLDTTTIQSGQLEYKKQHIDLTRLIEKVVDEIKMLHPLFNISFKKQDSIMVFADVERISQVLVNFLNNAIKFSADEKEIIIETSIEHGQAICKVNDNGFGIPQEQIDKVFDRFYRVSGTNSNTYPGMGLGLYIAKDIIEKHKGTIGATSVLHKGSTFYFTLPVDNPA